MIEPSPSARKAAEDKQQLLLDFAELTETNRRLAQAVQEAGIGRRATYTFRTVLFAIVLMLGSVGASGSVSYCLNDDTKHTACYVIPGYQNMNRIDSDSKKN